LLEADTSFIRNNIQSKVYGYYQFLRHVRGRTVFYCIIVFLAFGEFATRDFAALSAGFVLLLLTLLRLYYYRQSTHKFDAFVKDMTDSDFARQKFNQFDHENKGYLQVSDMSKLASVSGCCTRWLYETMFWRMDAQTNDGQVDVHEFVQFFLRYKEHSQMTEELLKERMYHNQYTASSGFDSKSKSPNKAANGGGVSLQANVYGSDNVAKAPPPVPAGNAQLR